MFSWAETTLSDLRQALRGMRRNPAYTVTAILASAVGIGASAAVFSAVDRVLFRALPYRDEARLVSVGMLAPLDTAEFLLADAYIDLRRHPGPFAAVSAFQAGASACDLTEASPLRLDCMRVEANFLDALGVRPIAGRGFTREEDLPNGPHVALISYGLWRSRFGGDPRVPGRTLALDGVSTVVTGVLPPDFLMPTLAHADILLPLNLDESREHSGRAFRAFARLRPGLSLEAARAELAPYFARALLTVPPQFRKEIGFRLRPVRDRQLGGARVASLALFGAVLSVLLIACANLANLLLARGAGRQREMAVRAALGASRSRLARLVLAESMLLTAAGAAAGCALAFALLRVFQALGPGALPRLEEAAIGWRVLAFAAAAAVISGLAAGLAATGPGAFTAQPLIGTRATNPARGWLRGTLVAAQIAVSLVLLAGAGLLLRSLWNLERIPLGMDGGHVVTASFSLGRQGYGSPPRQLAFFTALEQHLAALPGAQAVAITDSVPPTGGTRSRPLASIAVEGQAARPEGTGGMVTWRFVTPGYFAALGIPIRRGGGFTAEDRATGVYSIILSQTLARMLFPNQDPLGRRVLRGPNGEWFTVVGVAADVRNRGPATGPEPEYYVVRKPAADVTWNNQEPPMGWRSAYVLVRTPIDPRFAAADLRQLIAAIDPALPVEIGSMSARIQSVTERPRFDALLLGSFAAIGVLLAAIGLFGVMSFLVAQQRREIGVRMALGATPDRVLLHVLKFALRWAAFGTAAGIPGALAISRWLRSLLFQVPAGDPAALLAPALLLALVALVAAAGPAWRASRLDPATTLREE
jgi:putative ABC transport system permease protein